MKKFLAVALGIFLATSQVSAEQPKAQEYREILSSEKFYVEYDDKYVKRIIVEEDGRRMSRIALNSNKQNLVNTLNPIAKLFEGGFSKYPDFMYYQDKYYKFSEKDTAIMVRADQLDDVNLNPNEGWSLIHKELALPDELAVFNWNDKHHKVTDRIAAPTFANTIKKVIGNKEFTCDRYEADVKNARGEKEATIIFDMCYNDKGTLPLCNLQFSPTAENTALIKLKLKKSCAKFQRAKLFWIKKPKFTRRASVI